MSLLSVTVNHRHITANVATLRARTGEAEVMAVVKANAYGHGLVPSAIAAREGGATWLGVAQPSEALTLRKSGDTGRILTWLYGPELPAAALIAASVDLSVSSADVLGAIIVAARDAHEAPRIHLCIDTGLGREGVTLADLSALLDLAKAAEDEGLVRIVGMWSHLAWADAPGHPTIDAQAATFRQALSMTQDHSISLEVRHLANSAATLTRPDLHFDLVRPGIAVYGLPPVEDPEGHNFGLVPAMSVTASIALVKDVPQGQGVSYGHDYITPYPTTLALVSSGYADGVFRSAGNAGPVSIRGREFQIAGRVCMDQFVVDVGPATDILVGDTVTLIGPDGPTARDWANAVGTIDYEVVCRFGTLLQAHES